MSQTIQSLLRQLCWVAGPDAATSDADLLDRFASGHDGEAFAALVARHGPMVLGVCRRRLGDSHDAEDAFQATFLVLARKARTLGRHDSVGAWLHGVACRVVAHLRVDRAKRQDRERRKANMATADLTPAILWDDLRPVLDEEVQRLPNRYRLPVVLCYLGGMTYDEAARQLGCPKGTLATRLTRARALLRDRLTERGIVPSAAALAVTLADNAWAAVPPTLFHTTVAAATSAAAPFAVTTLAEGVLRAMFATKLKTISLLTFVASLLLGGAVLAHATIRIQQGGPDLASRRTEREPPVPGQLPAESGWIRVASETKILVFRPDGTGRTEYPRAARAKGILSPDRNSLLEVRTGFDTSAIVRTDAAGKNALQLSPQGVYAESPVWSPDGQRVAFVAIRNNQRQVHLMDRDGQNVRQLTVAPFGAAMPQFAADGRLTYLVYRDPVGKRQRADLVLDGGSPPTVLVQNMVFASYLWSPDGKLIAYSKPNALVFHDVASGQEKEVALTDIDERLRNHAVVWLSWNPQSQAVVCGMVFWGGRMARGPKMLGDEEVFVIPREGKPTWFEVGGPIQGVRWTRDRVTEE